MLLLAPFLASFRRFRELFLTGFKAVQRHMREIETLIWPMFPSSDHRMTTQVSLLSTSLPNNSDTEPSATLYTNMIESY